MEFLINYNINEGHPYRETQYISLFYIMKEAIEHLLEEEKVKKNRDIFDRLNVIYGPKESIREESRIESWKRLLQKQSLSLPYALENLCVETTFKGNKDLHSLMQTMLENYLQGKTNLAPSEKFLKWFLPDPKSEGYKDCVNYVHDKDTEARAIEEWKKTRDPKEDFELPLFLEQLHHRYSFVQSLILEKPQEGEEENLYHKVCKKLYGERSSEKSTSTENLPLEKKVPLKKAREIRKKKTQPKTKVRGKVASKERPKGKAATS